MKAARLVLRDQRAPGAAPQAKHMSKWWIEPSRRQTPPGHGIEEVGLALGHSGPRAVHKG